MHARNSSSNFHSSYINYRIFVRWSPLDGTSPLPPSGFQNSFDAFVNPLRENRSSLASAKEQREKRGGRGCKRWRNVEEICRGWQPPLPPTRQFGCRNIFGETSITHIPVRNSFPVWKASVGMPSPPYPPSSNAPHSSPLLLLLSFDACWRRCNRCCVRAHRIRMHMYGNGGRGRRGRGLMQRLLTFSNARWPATHATDSKIVPWLRDIPPRWIHCSCLGRIDRLRPTAPDDGCDSEKRRGYSSSCVLGTRRRGRGEILLD